MAGASAQEEIDEPADKFLRPLATPAPGITALDVTANDGVPFNFLSVDWRLTMEM
jgi:hypothetical protein